MADGHKRPHPIVAAIPYLWLAAFFLVPFVIVFRLSLSDDVLAQPPYAPLLDWSAGWNGVHEFLAGLDFENYVFVLSDSLYIEAYWQSVWIAALSTVILMLIGFPVAYGMARAPRGWRPLLLMLVILPFWTSFLIRVYAWMGILTREGLLNQALLALGVIDEPLDILATNAAVILGIVYSYLPFMVLPLYAALEKQEETLLEAAADLGAPPWKSFWLVTFPLALPGLVAGSLLCFIPAVGEFVIPDLLGGSDTLMIGRTLWTEFFTNRSWSIASTIAVLLLLVLVVPIALYQNIQSRSLERR
ncbi:MAG TPA: ABC transporter permease subunit [Xanthobacteraceae bacterium]|nr:ABC transporter permease subunit [Xanthobacteraceae bacterium]